MPSQPSSETFVRTVKTLLEAEDRNPTWLAKKIGQPDSTTRLHLERPELVGLDEALAMAAAFGFNRLADLDGMAA